MRDPEGLRDLHKGKTAAIVGTGPSLHGVDVDAETQELVTLGFGRSCYLFRADYYSIADKWGIAFLEDSATEPGDCNLLLEYYLKDHEVRDERLKGFAKDTFHFPDRETPILQPGYSVNFLLGLCRFMGMQDVFLYGVDLFYPEARSHANDVAPPWKFTGLPVDGKAGLYTNPHLMQQAEELEASAHLFADMTVLNMSKHSRLQCYPKHERALDCETMGSTC
jgi:hypothetical protein